MTQLVTRIDAELVASIDELIDQGLVESRSDAVRKGLHILIDHARRQRVVEAIIDGYKTMPQTEDVMWADEATVRMIGGESW